MGKGLPRSHSRGAFAGGAGKSGTIKFKDVPITIDGATGIGFGTVPIGDFPQGNILFKGAVCYMTVEGAGSQAGLVDTWSGDYAIGTTPTGDATLDGTDVNIVASTALGPAVAEVSPRTRGVGSTLAIFDNTDGSLELNANVIVDDANISADGVAATLSGELHISFEVLGDD